MEFLKSLILVSEKAANIARICRQNEHLFHLLVQQKNAKEANPRFVEDFKTLADVLIQEMVKHDLGKQFPELLGFIRGEENNTFSNKLGETIRVEVKQQEGETSELLRIVLNGDNEAADLLAAEVHKVIEIEGVNTKLPDQKFSIDLNELGVWIDPIDCTAEYINGNENSNSANGICISGLQCVTVLIGVYNKNTNLPVIGVVNQPFLHKENSTWRGQCTWGVSLESTSFSSVIKFNSRNNIISISSSEDEQVKKKLKEKEFKLVEASGAGYKILTVITGLADAYVLSKNSTFKWDTCAPQAILRSLGGDILIYDEILHNNKISVTYPCINEKSNNCNCGGFIAYQREEVLKKIGRTLV